MQGHGSLERAQLDLAPRVEDPLATRLLHAPCRDFHVGLALALLSAVVYGLGLGNALIFDDARLTDGTLAQAYGGLWPLKQRLLSYGSFVWLDQLADCPLAAEPHSDAGATILVVR